MPKGPDDHINELDAEIERLRNAIEDALTTLGGMSGQTIDAVVDILRGALGNDGDRDA